MINKTVLIVEFEHQKRVALRASIERLGYEVLSAATGQGAMVALHSRPEIGLMVAGAELVALGDLLRFKLDTPKLAEIPLVCIGSSDLTGVSESLPSADDEARLGQLLRKYLGPTSPGRCPA